MKTKILLMFCALLLTAAPAMAVNIVGFNIVIPNGPPELSGMFSIDFDSTNRDPSGIMLHVGSKTFIQSNLSDNTSSSFTLNLGVINKSETLVITALTPIEWNMTGGIIRIEGTDLGALCSFCEWTAEYAPKPVGNPVPEPTTMMLLSTGLVGLVGYRWRQGRAERLQVG